MSQIALYFLHSTLILHRRNLDTFYYRLLDIFVNVFLSGLLNISTFWFFESRTGWLPEWGYRSTNSVSNNIVIISAFILLQTVTLRVIVLVYVMSWGLGHLTMQIAYTYVGEDYCGIFALSRKTYQPTLPVTPLLCKITNIHRTAESKFYLCTFKPLLWLMCTKCSVDINGHIFISMFIPRYWTLVSHWCYVQNTDSID